MRTRLLAWFGATIALTAGLIAVIIAVFGTGRDTLDRCSMTPRGFPTRFTSVTVDWEWFPPGNVCVWHSPRGEEMRRRPDEIYPWRDKGEGGEKLR